MANFFGIDEKYSKIAREKNKNLAREKRIQENLSLYKESEDLANEMKAEESVLNEEMRINTLIGKPINESINNRRRQAVVKSNLKNELKDKLLVSFLTETVIDGLVFDEYFVNEHVNEIRNELHKTFTELLESGRLTESNFTNSPNIFIQDAYQEFKDIANYIVESSSSNYISEEQIIKILNEAKSKDTSKEIAENVKGKVLDTLEKEKRISKKKKEDTDEEEKEAAESLDKDVDEETGDDTEDVSDDDFEEDTDDEMDEDTEDDSEDEEMDSDESSDEDDSLDDDSEEDTDDEMDEDTEDDSGEEDIDSDESSDEVSSDSGDNNLVITVKTNGSSVSVSANKSESLDYLNMFNFHTNKQKKIKERKTIFRHLMESSLNENIKFLQESGITINEQKPVNMDTVLAETIINYTVLETLNTANILGLNTQGLVKLSESLNLYR